MGNCCTNRNIKIFLRNNLSKSLNHQSCPHLQSLEYIVGEGGGAIFDRPLQPNPLTKMAGVSGFIILKPFSCSWKQYQTVTPQYGTDCLEGGRPLTRHSSYTLQPNCLVLAILSSWDLALANGINTRRFPIYMVKPMYKEREGQLLTGHSSYTLQPNCLVLMILLSWDVALAIGINTRRYPLYML